MKRDTRRDAVERQLRELFARGLYDLETALKEAGDSPYERSRAVDDCADLFAAQTAALLREPSEGLEPGIVLHSPATGVLRTRQDDEGQTHIWWEQSSGTLGTPTDSPTPRRPTDAEIDRACMWYRHDYGLMDESEWDNLRAEALEWLRAWIKVRDGECPGWDPRRASDSPTEEDEYCCDGYGGSAVPSCGCGGPPVARVRDRLSSDSPAGGTSHPQYAAGWDAAVESMMPTADEVAEALVDAGLARRASDSPPLELRLCETSRLVLKPDVLYRFTVDPDCGLCRADARSANTSPAERCPKRGMRPHYLPCAKVRGHPGSCYLWDEGRPLTENIRHRHPDWAAPSQERVELRAAFMAGYRAVGGDRGATGSFLDWIASNNTTGEYDK